MMALASPMSTADTARIGGNRTTAVTIGALKRAARSGLWTAQFFGTASKKTKMTTTSKTAPREPRCPEQVLGQHPDQGGRHQLADQHQKQDRVEELLGVLDEAYELAGPAALVVEQGLGLDAGRAHQAGLGDRQDARGEQQHGDDRPVRQRQPAANPLGRRSGPRRPVAGVWTGSTRSSASMASASASASWSRPKRCKRPWTTNRAISSLELTSWSSALRAATAGQITTSPSSVRGTLVRRQPRPGAPEVGDRPTGPGRPRSGRPARRSGRSRPRTAG